MSRSSLIALVVLSLGSFVVYGWLLHAVIGFSVMRVIVIFALVLVTLTIATYRRIRERGIEPHIGANATRIVKTGTLMLVVGGFAWSTIYLRQQGHHPAGFVTAICSAGTALYAIRTR